jgi:mono/diheme cytochrome c family protein
MEVIAFLLPFVLLGAVVVFIAFSGGPGAAREAYLTRGNRLFRMSMVAIYVVFGLVVPVGSLRAESLSETEERGKDLFRQQCASCHSLSAVNARGITGPNLDRIGDVTPERIISAIRIGGTGQKRMPAQLLEGEEARAVAEYVAKVAGSN